MGNSVEITVLVSLITYCPDVGGKVPVVVVDRYSNLKRLRRSYKAVVCILKNKRD